MIYMCWHTNRRINPYKDVEQLFSNDKSTTKLMTKYKSFFVISDIYFEWVLCMRENINKSVKLLLENTLLNNVLF